MASSYIDNAPSCFADPETNRNQHHLKMLRRFGIKGNAEPSDSHIRQLAHGLYIGDPLADQWIEDARSLSPGQGTKLLDAALDHGIESLDSPPKSLVELFKELDKQPMWLDPYLLDLGAKAYQRHGRIGISALNNVGLMGGYYASAVIKPLIYTGRLDYKAEKRVSETTKFTLDVSYPGNMQRFKAGFRAAVKVRMMHAMARSMVQKAEGWSNDEWGIPINQPGMLGTNMQFSYSYIQTCKAHGCRFTDEEEVAILHLWRYVGYLMGVNENTLPATMQEAARTSYAIGCIQAPPDQDSYALAQALHIVPLERAKTRWQRVTARVKMRLNAGTTRFFMGKEISDALGIPGQISQYAIPIMAPANYIAESLRQLLPGGTYISTLLGQRYRKRYVEKITRGEENPYTSVKQVKNIGAR